MTSLPIQPSADKCASKLCLPDQYVKGKKSALTAVPPHMSLAPYYDLAMYLRMITGTACILDIGPSDASQLSSRFGPESVAVVGNKACLERARRFLPKNRLFMQNFGDVLSLPDEILKQSIVVCADLLNRLQDPEPMLASLKRISEVAPYVIIGTPDRARAEGYFHHGPPSVQGSVQHWRFDEWVELLSSYGIEMPFAGHVGPWALDKERVGSLVLTGTQCLTKAAPRKSVVALVSCYNDIDIIMHCYEHLKKQGVHVAFIDNWSSDGTWEKIEALKSEEPGVCVHAERFPPEGPSGDYEWAKILQRKTQLAQELQFDWYMHHDSDELRESPIPSLTLAEAISRVDALGYSVIDHTVLDFRPTDASFHESRQPQTHFRYFEFGSRVDHFMQIKAWKRQEQQVDLVGLGGHVVIFPKARLYPFNFLLRHYSIRSPEHARKKFFQHRLPRIKKEENSLRWHTHLQSEVNARQEHEFLWDARELLPFGAEQFYDEYVLPRLTGLGVHEANRLTALSYYVRQEKVTQP